MVTTVNRLGYKVELASMNKIELASMNKIELASMNKIELASMNKVELTSLNNAELASMNNVVGYIKDNIWHLHSLSTDKFEYQKDIHFKTQPGPVTKNATFFKKITCSF